MTVFPAYAAERITVNCGKANIVKITPNAAGNYTAYSNQLICGKETKTFEYHVNAPEAGVYHFSIEAKFGADGQATFTVPGDTLVVNKSSVPRQEIYVGRVNLVKGENAIIFKNTGNSGIEFHNMFFDMAGDRVETDFTRTSGAYKNYYIPTIIQAEDYDIGANGSYTVNNDTAQTTYRGEANLPISTNAENANVITLRTNEWANYTFTAPSNGSYNVAVKTNVKGNMEMYFDDMPYPITFMTGECKRSLSRVLIQLRYLVHEFGLGSPIYISNRML